VRVTTPRKLRWKLATARIFGDDPPPGIPWTQRATDVYVSGYRMSGSDLRIVYQVFDEKRTLVMGWRTLP
jgi:hypothetical protein